MYSRLKLIFISPYDFFIRFLLLFFALYYFFPFYWGVVGVGGNIYSSFLADNFNFIKGLSAFVTSGANIFLKVLGYHTTQNFYNVLRIGTSNGVIVNPSCLGWAVMSFWVAFVFANPGSWKHKMKWMLTGIFLITILNIFRISFIVLANHLHWNMITRLDHHQTFNIVSYCCIFILMFWYVKVQKKYERFINNSRQTNDKLSAI